MSAIARIKGALPWWARILAKVVLARLPLGGRTWQRLGVFSPGAMLDPDYAIAVFEHHYGLVGSPAEGFTFLELGPGDSLASAPIGRAFGAARGWLVDAGAYASRDIRIYRRLIDTLAERHEQFDAGALQAAKGIETLLQVCNARYLEEGLASLREIPDGTCDFTFSQAVLEHLPRDEFAATLAELYRILKPGAMSSHQIDFRDHLGGGLDNLRFSERLWEAPWFAQRSGFYTNRLRHGDMDRAFRAAGFEVEWITVNRYDAPPIEHRHLAPQFRDMDAAELCIKDGLVTLKKTAGGS
jgi:SAM-dependent methyltransferase